MVKFTLDGKLIHRYELPDGLRHQNGLTGIAIGNDGSLLIELEGGLKVTKYISASGEIIEKTRMDTNIMAKSTHSNLAI